jgi:hypothetical protein
VGGTDPLFRVHPEIVIGVAREAWGLSLTQSVVGLGELLGRTVKEHGTALQCCERRARANLEALLQKVQCPSRGQLPLRMILELGQRRGVEGMIAAGLLTRLR